jgi:succinate dehydrogenase hydrophobic anchor subunit
MRTSYFRLLQLITGVAVFFLIAVHVSAVRLDNFAGIFGVDVEEPTSWGSVMDRAVSTGWASFYIILLAVAIYHALYGLRVVLMELPLPPVIARSLNYIMIGIGVAVFGYGTFIALNAYYS